MVVNINADALYIIEKLISHRRDSNSHVASIQITLTLRPEPSLHIKMLKSSAYLYHQCFPFRAC